MSVISFANPKGGSGKSTAALVLALEFAREAKVAIIDADPNAVILNWAKRREGSGRGVPVTVVAPPGDNDELDIADIIDSLSESHDVVFVDLEGTASMLMANTIACSDLVIIPLMPSPVDAELAAKAVKLVRVQSKTLRREVPFRLVWSKKPAAVQSRSYKRIAETIASLGFKTLASGLVERAAFRDIFETGDTLQEMLGAIQSRRGGEGLTKRDAYELEQNLKRVTQSQENAFALAQEVVEVIKESNK